MTILAAAQIAAKRLRKGGELLQLDFNTSVTYCRAATILSFLLIIIGLPHPLAAENPSLQQPSPQPDRPLRVEVESIVLNVLVIGSGGIPVEGLKKENFRVFEDGVEQRIQAFFPIDAPFSIALVLDTSYSAVGKLPVIQDSAIRFLRELHPQDEVAVLSFDDEVYLETEFTSSRKKAERAVKQTRTGESTQLFEAVYLGMDQLDSRPERKAMVLFTDGVDTSSSTTSAGETIKVAEESDIAIYPIYFDTEQETLRRIRSGGPFIATPGGMGTPGTVPGRNPGPVGVPGQSPFPVPTPVPQNSGEIARQEQQTRSEYQRARSYLKELAEVTGGTFLRADASLSNLEAVFAQLAAQMRSLYGLSYVSSNQSRDGKFRRIEVKVDLEGVKVRTRKGYRNRKD